MSDQETVARDVQLTFAQLVRVSLDLLSARAARWVTLLMAFGLFAFAAWAPSWVRLAIAATFTVLVHLPLWLRKETR